MGGCISKNKGPEPFRTAIFGAIPKSKRGKLKEHLYKVGATPNLMIMFAQSLEELSFAIENQKKKNISEQK